MVTLNLASNARAYSLPNATLTTMTLPKIGRAVAQARWKAFERFYPGAVNLATDSNLCVQAFKVGFIGSSELSILENHPNSYGLYQLRELTADAIGKGVTIQAKGNFVDEEALLVSLNDRHYDLQSASSSVLQCIEAGLLQVSEIEGLLQYGQKAGAALIDKVIEAIEIEVCSIGPMAENLMVYAEGDWLALNMCGLAVIELQLPDKIDNDFAPINALLFKTIHALQQVFFFFQSTNSFLGQHSYYCDPIGSTYQELAGQIGSLGFEGLKEYLGEMGEARYEYEIFEWLSDDPDNMEETIEYAAKLLTEMHMIQTRTDFSVNASDEGELHQVLQEAREHLRRPSPYTTVLEAIVGALEACVEHGTANAWDEQAYYEAYGDQQHEENMSFFDGMLVQASWHTPNLMDYSCGVLDAHANEMGGPCLRLPLSGHAMSEITLPLIKNMGECFRLLGRISDALEETHNAGNR